MSRKLALAVGISIMCGLVGMQIPAEEGLQEKVGKSLERAGNPLADELSKEWGQLRGVIEKMDLRGRVYSRLYWDRNQLTIEETGG